MNNYLYADYWEMYENLYWETLDPELQRELCTI